MAKCADVSTEKSDLHWEILAYHSNVSDGEMRRLGEKLRTLQASPGPANLLRTWLRKRGQVLGPSCSKNDVQELRKNPRLVPSGISDGRCNLSAGNHVEAYIQSMDVKTLRAD